MHRENERVSRLLSSRDLRRDRHITVSKYKFLRPPKSPKERARFRDRFREYRDPPVLISHWSVYMICARDRHPWQLTFVT